LNDIRVTYSGLIAFLVSITGVLTGTFFVIIITRNLTVEEFGLWTLIGSMVSYVIIIDPIISYWSTRQIARGEPVAKTALGTGVLFSLGGFTAYSIIALSVSFSLGASIEILMLASALVPLTILNGVIGSIFLGQKPHVVSYGLITFESSKIPFGLLFIYFGQMGIAGVVLSVVCASSLRIVILLILVRPLITGKIKKSAIKFWLKMSWLIAYQQGNGIIYRLDVMVVSFMTSSLTVIAFWGVALTIGYLANHAGHLSQALYPKLLANGKKDFIKENLKITLYVSIPILTASIVFAKPAIHILNPIYIDAVYAVYFTAAAAFTNTLRSVFFKILSGYEKIDVEQQASFKKYVKSKLFLTPTLDYVYSGSYVIILLLFFVFFRDEQMLDFEIVTIWAFIMFIVAIPVTAYTIRLCKKQYDISLPLLPILKYVIAAILSGLIAFYIIENYLTYPESIFDFLPGLIQVIFLSGFIYFGITFMIDKSIKKLFISILNEIKNKI
jgi:O-antigen/teichoic acid export membrane protein